MSFSFESQENLPTPIGKIAEKIIQSHLAHSVSIFNLLSYKQFAFPSFYHWPSRWLLSASFDFKKNGKLAFLISQKLWTLPGIVSHLLPTRKMPKIQKARSKKHSPLSKEEYDKWQEFPRNKLFLPFFTIFFSIFARSKVQFSWADVYRTPPQPMWNRAYIFWGCEN